MVSYKVSVCNKIGIHYNEVAVSNTARMKYWYALLIVFTLSEEENVICSVRLQESVYSISVKNENNAHISHFLCVSIIIR